jgi:hypothetical protein
MPKVIKEERHKKKTKKTCFSMITISGTCFLKDLAELVIDWILVSVLLFLNSFTPYLLSSSPSLFSSLKT